VNRTNRERPWCPRGLFLYLLISGCCDKGGCEKPNHFLLRIARGDPLDLAVKGRMPENFVARKVDKLKVDAIRFIYQETKTSYKRIGAYFHVSASTIGAIINHESWK